MNLSSFIKIKPQRMKEFMFNHNNKITQIKLEFTRIYLQNKNKQQKSYTKIKN